MFCAANMSLICILQFHRTTECGDRQKLDSQQGVALEETLKTHLSIPIFGPEGAAKLQAPEGGQVD